MDIKQNSIGDILDAEKEMVLGAAERYGDYFINASEFNLLLQDFLRSVDRDRFVFTAFLSVVKKHSTPALFSAVRLHHVQAMLDMRQVLEAGASAAFAIANTDLKHFLITKDGLISEPKDLTTKRYTWLNEHFPGPSLAIRNMKTEAINKSTAHASLTYALKHFGIDNTGKKFNTTFFDSEIAHHVETDLWMIGNVLMGLMDLFYGVTQKHGGLVFKEDFVPRLKALEAQNHSLKREMEGRDWFKKVRKSQQDTSVTATRGEKYKSSPETASGE